MSSNLWFTMWTRRLGLQQHTVSIEGHAASAATGRVLVLLCQYTRGRALMLRENFRRRGREEGEVVRPCPLIVLSVVTGSSARPRPGGVSTHSKGGAGEGKCRPPPPPPPAFFSRAHAVTGHSIFTTSFCLLASDWCEQSPPLSPD